MGKIQIKPKTLLYPMPAVLVGAVVDGRPNFMTVAWCGIAAHEPPALSVAIHRARHTLKGILQNKTFSVNIPSSTLVKKVDFCGLYSGKDTDKSGIFQVFYGSVQNAPLIQECPINLGLSYLDHLELGSHFLIVGKIEEVLVEEACIQDGKVDPYKVDPMIYATEIRKYLKIGSPVAEAFKVGKAEGTLEQ